jgi:hypothetical protein
MKSVRFVLPLVALLALAWSFTVYANDETRPAGILARDSDASLTVNETFSVLVDVEVQIDGETFVMAVPATLRVDSRRLLSEARLIADNHKRVGTLAWDIRTVEEHVGEYALTRFTTITPVSPNNKLVVVQADVTNLGRTPLNTIFDLRDELAYDELGNLYDSTRTQCDDINPGATGLCTLVFEVPHAVTLSGLELAVVDRRRMPLTLSGE